MRMVLLAGVLGLCTAARVHAQDMAFGIDETGPDPSPGISEQPSQTLTAALNKYDLGLHAEAAVLLQRVVEGTTQDSPSRVEQAQFFLGKALLRLDFLQSALNVFDELASDGARHSYALKSLPWLVEIGQRLPDPSSVSAIIGRFDPASLEPAARTLEPEPAARLWVLAGQAALAQGAYELAIERFGRVAADSSAYLRAQFFTAIAEVRRRKAKPAIAAFQRVLHALDEGRGEEGERDRMRNLAWLSLGRIYYTAAFTAPKKDEGKLLGSAVDAWSRVEESSDEWLDAMFESAWALFVTDEHSRALGNLHGLLSPFFADAFYPEAYVLRSVIYFDSCQLDNTDATLDKFHRLYDPVRDELMRATDGDFDTAAALALLATVDQGGKTFSERTRAVLKRELADRELTRARNGVLRLEQEQAALERAPAGLRDSSLAERIRQDVLVGHSFQREQLGALVQARVTRLLRELQEVANQADTVEIETLKARRGILGVKPVTPPPSGRRVHVDSEHVLWPFNGEYWRDEIGYYRQELTNHCAPR